jgi:hypothetical protein
MIRIPPSSEFGFGGFFKGISCRTPIQQFTDFVEWTLGTNNTFSG